MTVQMLTAKGQMFLIDFHDYDEVMVHSWFMDKLGYIRRNIPHPTIPGKRTVLPLHRFVVSAKPGELIDHENRLPWDCRRSNLRRASRAQNMVKSDKIRSSSGFRGVKPHRKRWRAQIFAIGKWHSLGVFTTKEQAATAYNDAAKKFFGEFAYLNPV